MFTLAGAVTAGSLFSSCASGVRGASAKPATVVRDEFSFVRPVLPPRSNTIAITPDPEVPRKPTTVERIAYHGWKSALRMRNDRAEVVVVPEIGRVMSFRFLNGENVFWEDRSLDGKHGDVSGKEWVNFGGDKTWPAPEADWGKYTGRTKWMPPAAFDAMPHTARIEGRDVVLTSLVDPHYGIRTIRRVQLDGSRLRIATTYERVFGKPSKIGIWVITQFREPVNVTAPFAKNSAFPDGYSILSGKPWAQLQRTTKHGFNHLEITRDPKAPHKMACAAGGLTWVGTKEICAVLSPRVRFGKYPDGGASAEVYTNANPKKYVELEMLGPLSVMKVGDRISRTNDYFLLRN